MSENYNETIAALLERLSVLERELAETRQLLAEKDAVIATGYNEDGQCNVDDWRDIAAVSAGGNHTVGLRIDGTVVAVGQNAFGQCNVEDWQNIAAISSGTCHTVGLRKDGTVVAVGESGQCDVSDHCQQLKDFTPVCWFRKSVKTTRREQVFGGNGSGFFLKLLTVQ